MSPPRPPLPPSGPPSGLNFSRFTETHPSPPLPAVAWRVTRSTNVAIFSSCHFPHRFKFLLIEIKKRAALLVRPALYENQN